MISRARTIARGAPHSTTPRRRGARQRRWLGPILALALLAPLAGMELFAEPPLADEADDAEDADDADDAEGSEDVAPADDGGIVPFNTSNPVQLNSKTIDTPSSPGDPLRPGDEIVYTLNYSCSSLATGGNCNDAVLVDPLPQLLDTDGDPVQLEFVDVNTMTPSHWAFQGESGSAPDQQITWEANDLDVGVVADPSARRVCPSAHLTTSPVAPRVGNAACPDTLVVQITPARLGVGCAAKPSHRSRRPAPQTAARALR